jgi:nicotinamidase-related amidase
MASIEVVDRSSLISGLYEQLVLNPRETAIVTIDMHRGHLDLDVATMPAKPDDARRVIARGREVLDFARTRGIPIIHVKFVSRLIPGLGSEGMASPFWHALHDLTEAEDALTPGRRSTVNNHNIQGSPGTEIIPELLDKRDFVIDTKRRLDCFFGTDLHHLLRVLGVRNVCLMGINTNTCVLNTAFTACNYDFRVVVLSDCVASMYGDDLHVFGLQNVSRCLGWVITNEQFHERIESAEREILTAAAG